MLRFSDSKLGGISTAYAAKSEDGTVDVKHLEPDTLKILQVKNAPLEESPSKPQRERLFPIWKTDTSSIGPMGRSISNPMEFSIPTLPPGLSTP